MPASQHMFLHRLVPAFALFLTISALAPGPVPANDGVRLIGNARAVQQDSLSDLQDFYQSLDYDWQRIDDGVPPFILERFPEDINHSTNITEKKHAFFMGLLPMILLVNQEVEQERKDLQAILERSRSGNKLMSAERRRLQELVAHYGLIGNPLTDHSLRAKLLRRIDIIPPSLVLAQAAKESAWGTSRFAQLGNNLFGEWTFQPGSGIVPEDRPAGATHEVRKFPSIYESIRSYMRNLNTHRAYRNLREIRSRLRLEEQPLTGLSLAPGLINYSQRRESYIDEIQKMIRFNRLAEANLAFLREDGSGLDTGVGDMAGLFSTRKRLIENISPLLPNP